MEYTVKALSQLSGVTPRTLRWYDKLGLLPPGRTTQAGYRIYGPAQVDRLQQILFYRELGLPLEEIKAVLDSPDFAPQEALQSHLKALKERRGRLDALIETVEKTLRDQEGEAQMTDDEKFAAFKREAVAKNETRYGKEVREAYGDQAADDAKRAFLSMTEETYAAWTALDREIKTALAAAVRAGAAPAGAEGQRIAALHEKWLRVTDKSYTREKHRGIAQLYVADERFTAYYDEDHPGCAQFLRDAVNAYAK